MTLVDTEKLEALRKAIATLDSKLSAECKTGAEVLARVHAHDAVVAAARELVRA